MDVRNFNVTPVTHICYTHFVKAEPLEKKKKFSKKVSAYLNVFQKKFFEHDEQKGLR
jgi:hypothetical protein